MTLTVPRSGSTRFASPPEPVPGGEVADERAVQAVAAVSTSSPILLASFSIRRLAGR